MKITILLIGKTEKDYLKKELDLFENRLKHYIPVEVNIIPAIKSSKNLLFVIGGPFGFHEKICEKANSVVSLYKMTFSHQMIRLLFIEQLYIAFTILRNEKYHH